MFEKIYSDQRTIAIHRSAPFLEERCRYLAHRAQLGAKRATIRKIAASQLKLVGYLDLSDNKKVSLSEIETATEQWSQLADHWYGRCASANAKTVFIGRAVRWLKYVDRYEVVNKHSHGLNAQVAEFSAWMEQDRGLAQTTIVGCLHTVNQFLAWSDQPGLSLVDFKTENVDEYLSHCQLGGGCCRGTIRTYTNRLRCFFRFAAQRGWCKPQIAQTMAPVARYPDEKIPTGFNRQEVERLLSAAQGNKAADQRSHAILVMLSEYGMRASEVCRLQLDDLNWRQETFRIRHSKSGKTNTFPLSLSAGESLIRYLQQVRPTGFGRSVFLTLRAPFRPLTSGGIRQIVYQYKAKAGISGKRKGPHGLRHGVAQHLLDQGLSMKTVGDYLGHRSICTTSVYAKINLDLLRQVAEIDLEGLA